MGGTRSPGIPPMSNQHAVGDALCNVKRTEDMMADPNVQLPTVSTTVVIPPESAPPAHDLDQGRRFLGVLDPDPDQNHYFVSLQDGPTNHCRNRLRGSFDAVADRLVQDNQAGYGIFVAINEISPGMQRRKQDVKRVRAIFADADEPERIPEVEAAIRRIGLPHPSIIVESSPGKRHYYWLTDDCPVHEFEPAQKALIKALGTDTAVNDLSRIMRLPGFIHRKGQPFRTRLVYPV